MPTTYDSYEAKCVQAAITLLTNSTTFAALVAPIAAADRIIEIDGGDEDEANPRTTASSGAQFAMASATAWAHVLPEAPDMPREWVAPQTITGSGTMPLAIYLRASSNLKPHEQLRWALGRAGLIRSEIEAQQGTSGIWRRVVCQLSTISRLDAAGYGRGLIRTSLSLQYGDIP